MGRMQRYEQTAENTKRQSRIERNQDLYGDLGRVEKTTSFAEIPKIEAVDLSSARENYQTREGYHQIREYGVVEQIPPIQKELEDLNYLYSVDEDKPHDINTILQEAKALREKDELERKRKLHNEKYNILESSEDELEKFKQQKDKKIKAVDDEEELAELINTITSKELREQIDEKSSNNSLLGDLMATNIHEEVLAPVAEKSAAMEEEKSKPIPSKKSKMMSEIDETFYTQSMDLNEQDFLSDGEDEYKISKGIIFLRVLFSLLLIGAVAVGIYYVITNF